MSALASLAVSVTTPLVLFCAAVTVGAVLSPVTGVVTAPDAAGKAALSERGLEVAEVTRAMRDRGLGTPATRAAILETLLRRDYVVRDGKMFVATDKGVGLVARVHPHVKSPAMTGEWEAKLLRIERGEEKLDAFMAEIARYVRDVVATATATPSRPRPQLRR